jgi:hypothetical protein
MAKLKTSFNMTSSTTSKSDPLSTYITAEVDVSAPLIQQGKLTTSASGDLLIDGTAAPFTTTDCYLYIRAAADNGANHIEIWDDSGAACRFGILEADDWMFIPMYKGFGVMVKATGGTPKLEYAYFLRA